MKEAESEAKAEATAVVPKEKTEINYSCDSCGTRFISHRARAGEKLCVNCVELRRALKSFTKRGLSEAEILKRSHKLLDVK